MERKKLLITGSAGFIGGNLIRKLIYEKCPYTISSIDRVNNNVINSLYINRDHHFYLGDVRDSHIVNNIFQFEKPDIVIHMAAESSVDKSIIDAHNFITSNVLGTQVIIDACLKYKVETLIYVSTDEVLGHLTNESEPGWTEESTPNPRNPYAASKLAGELLINASHHTHGLQYIITRASNNYGPRQTSDKLVPRTIKSILNNEKIQIYGKGEQIRSWIHVFDNCSAIMTLLEKGQPNQIYNVSAEQELTNLEMIQKICNTMGKGHNLFEFVQDRLGHDFRYSISANKLKKLGWTPKYKLSDGLAQTCEWYKANQFIFK